MVFVSNTMGFYKIKFSYIAKISIYYNKCTFYYLECSLVKIFLFNYSNF